MSLHTHTHPHGRAQKAKRRDESNENKAVRVKGFFRIFNDDPFHKDDVIFHFHRNAFLFNHSLFYSFHMKRKLYIYMNGWTGLDKEK